MEKLRIKMCVEEGRYEEALQVSVGCDVETLSRAHIRMLAKHRDCAATRELINRAKGRIVSETPLEKGRRFSRIGHKERAAALLSDAVQHGGDPDDFLLVGQLLEQLWRTDAALAYFEAAVRLRGDAADRRWMAATLERLGRFEEALNAYKQAARARGTADDFAAWGSLLYRIGKVDEAEKVLQKAEALGDRGAGPQLLQAIRTERGRARIRRLLSGIASFLNGREEGRGLEGEGRGSPGDGKVK